MTPPRTPTFQGVLAALERRVKILEGRTGRAKERLVTPEELIIHVPEVLVSGTYGDLKHRSGGKVVNVTGQLRTAGSSSSTVAVKKNGSTFLTLTFAASDTDETDVPATDTYFEPDVDKLSVTVTAGTGAAFLTVQVRFG